MVLRGQHTRYVSLKFLYLFGKYWEIWIQLLCCLMHWGSLFLFHFYFIFDVVLSSAELPDSTAEFFHIDYFFLTFAVVQLLSLVDSVSPWMQHARPPCLSPSRSNSCSLGRWCHPTTPPAFNFPSSSVFSSETALHIRWPKYWSLSFSIQWIFKIHFLIFRGSQLPITGMLDW